MLRINQIKININHSDYDLRVIIAKTINLSVDDINWSTLIILHKSIDARDRFNIKFVYNVAFDLFKEKKHLYDNKHLLKKPNISIYNEVIFNPKVDCVLKSKRPIVVGFGPAGIFASYILALNGFKPIVIERGKSIEERTKDVEKFFDTMELDENSNVCFGEGGAGAFSDGKLNTNNKDRTGIYRFILETFVKFGTSDKILYENLPHIGTDKLVLVIKNIRDEILRLGGEIHFNTKFSVKDGMLSETPTILAIGNSSRDTFKELIKCGFDVKSKPFAVGYRIANRQEMINVSQYGSSNNEKYREILGAATYKLTYDVGNGHSVYSFCMCPGGYIINSSHTKNRLAINGMSYNDRSGKYANSAIVESISPSDISKLNIEIDDVYMHEDISYENKLALKSIAFQEMIEKRNYDLENGFIPYYTNNKSFVCEGEIFKAKAKFCENIKSVYEDLPFDFNINIDIEKALAHFNKIIPGFYDINEKSKDIYVIAGVETKTSSPVKLERDENFMCNIKNFYPCGEGLGHGGGIMSCAADGINVALKVIENIGKS